MAISEITPTATKIDSLIHRIGEGNIKIPAFQRGFVWSQDQIIALLDSIYNDYPVGSILLWSSNERLKATRNVGGFIIPDLEPDYPINYVLDGQQRLSTIYAVFTKDRIQDPENEKYNLDITSFDIYFDLLERKFTPANSKDPSHKYLDLHALLIIDSFFKEVEGLSPDERKIAQDLYSKFINYEIPIVTIHKRQKDEVGVIFERINNTGTSLSTLDLVVAWTWSEDFHLREAITELLDNLSRKGFDDVPDKVILQALSGVEQKDTRTKAILSLKADTVKAHFEKMTQSIFGALDFLGTELNIVTRELMPHAQQIVPLTYFFSKVSSPSHDQSKIIKQWFWKTSFSRRYSAQTDDKMNEDIEFFEEIADGKFAGIDNYSYTVDKRILMSQKFTKESPFVRAFLLLMAQNTPLNLRSGNKIDLGELIFPRFCGEGIKP